MAGRSRRPPQPPLAPSRRGPSARAPACGITMQARPVSGWLARTGTAAPAPFVRAALAPEASLPAVRHRPRRERLLPRRRRPPPATLRRRRAPPALSGSGRGPPALRRRLTPDPLRRRLVRSAGRDTRAPPPDRRGGYARRGARRHRRRRHSADECRATQHRPQRRSPTDGLAVHRITPLVAPPSPGGPPGSRASSRRPTRRRTANDLTPPA